MMTIATITPTSGPDAGTMFMWNPIINADLMMTIAYHARATGSIRLNGNSSIFTSPAETYNFGSVFWHAHAATAKTPCKITFGANFATFELRADTAFVCCVTLKACGAEPLHASQHSATSVQCHAARCTPTSHSLTNRAGFTAPHPPTHQQCACVCTLDSATLELGGVVQFSPD
jgi:hypothetical protein